MANPRQESCLAPAIGFMVLLLVIGALGYGAWAWLSGRSDGPSLRLRTSEQCVATAAGDSESLDLEQSRNAGIIAAEAMRRGLPPRAVTIALATAMQESSLRNIDYGDRDSIGLFQQRPSQGWGTVDQIMDPWYSAGRFYQALVKVPDWQNGDVNDVAQTVQRSGFPEAYRKWEGLARTFASVLTGNSPAGLSCVRHGAPAPVTQTLDRVLTSALGSRATTTRTAQHLVMRSRDARTLWAGVALAMSQTEQVRFVRVEAAGRVWQHDEYSVAGWQTASPATPASPGSSPTQILPQAGPTTAVLTLG